MRDVISRPPGVSESRPLAVPSLLRPLLPASCLLIAALALQGAAGASDSTARPRTTLLPVLSYSDVTGVQYGATLFRSFRVGADPATRGSSAAIYAARTAKRHAKAYLQLERWSERNQLRSRARIEHQSYPLPFFGVGTPSPDSAEEWYSSGVTTVHLQAQREWRHAAYLLGGLRFIRTRLHEAEPSGVIAGGAVPGSSGGNVVATELGLVVDGRDVLASPRTGIYARVITSIAARVIGGNFSFRRLTLDARRYVPLGTTHVGAIQLQYDGVAGSIPFDQLPMIGADSAMRGYPRGRYRDNHAITVQAEVRSGYWRRAGLVAFAGAGTIGSSIRQLGAGTWYPTAGMGVRGLLVPKDRTVARLDLAFGRGSFGFNVGIGEAF